MQPSPVTLRSRFHLRGTGLTLSVLSFGIFALLAATARVAAAAPVETVSNLEAAGPGSLAGALEAVDPGGRVEFEPGLAGTIVAGDFGISKGVTVDGPGADQISIEGDNRRIFYVNSAEPVTIAGLKLTGGRVAVRNVDGWGGAIANVGSGRLTLRDLEISGNEVVATNGSAGGGGVSIVAGSALLERVALVDNVARAVGGQARGGGLEVFSNAGAVALRDVTVVGNRVESPDSLGGGIAAFNRNVGKRLDLEQVTLVDNHSTYRAGGLYDDVSVDLAGTVIAGNAAAAGADCLTQADGMLEVTAPSLIEDPSGCTVAGPIAPLTDVSPMLGEPGVHALGATTTLLPRPGSPLIDAIAPAAAGPCAPGATDQRGVPRPQGPACDIGAVEVEVADDGNDGGTGDGEHPSAPEPAPGALPLPAGIPTIAPAPRVERLDLRRCVRAERRGRPLRIPLRVSLSSPAAVQVTVERATARRAARRCPAKRAGNPDYSGRFQRVRTSGSLAATASNAAVAVRRRIIVRARLAPGLYRISVRAAGTAEPTDAGQYRWLRVLRR